MFLAPQLLTQDCLQLKFKAANSTEFVRFKEIYPQCIFLILEDPQNAKTATVH